MTEFATALHTALAHLEKPNSNVRMLFVDFMDLVVSLDNGFSHRQTSAGESRESHLIHNPNEHWHLTGLGAEANSLHTVHL